MSWPSSLPALPGLHKVIQQPTSKTNPRPSRTSTSSSSSSSYNTSTMSNTATTSALSLPDITLPSLAPGLHIPSLPGSNLRTQANQPSTAVAPAVTASHNSSTSCSSGSPFSDSDWERSRELAYPDSSSLHANKRKHKKSATKRATKRRKLNGPTPSTASNPNTNSAKKKKVFQCTKCRRSFATNRALASHQRAHKNKVPPAPLKTLGVSSSSNSSTSSSVCSIPQLPMPSTTTKPTTLPSRYLHLLSHTHQHSYPPLAQSTNSTNSPTTPSATRSTEAHASVMAHMPAMAAMRAIQQTAAFATLPTAPDAASLPKVGSLTELKSLTRLAMPTIKGRKNYKIKRPASSMDELRQGGVQKKEEVEVDAGNDEYKYHCSRCAAAFFYEQDLVQHKACLECAQRPYLCPFCERPFKSVLSVKKHCVNLHSSVINWDLVGNLLQFVKKHEDAHAAKHAGDDGEDLNYVKLVRKFARDFYLWNQMDQHKDKMI